GGAGGEGSGWSVPGEGGDVAVANGVRRPPQPSPVMCIIASRMFIGRRGSTSVLLPSASHSRTFRFAHEGMKRATGSLSWNRPRSYNDISATPVIGFVIE